MKIAWIPAYAGTCFINFINFINFKNYNMTNKVKPLGDNVLVKVKKQEKKTKSGIVLPDTADDEKPQIGEVISVGDDEKKIKVKAGQDVIFAKYSGTEIKIENEEYLILKSEDILAVAE